MADLLDILWWPTSKLIHTIQSILAPFWTVLRFVFLPLAYLVEAVLDVVLFPFRIDLLERIETIYIWLGVAALVGCITGATLYLTYRGIVFAFNIDAATRSVEPKKQKHVSGKTMEEYRAARHAKRGTDIDSLSSPTAMRPRGARRRNLSSYAIMEEESEF